jgi:hypothetical protein
MVGFCVIRCALCWLLFAGLFLIVPAWAWPDGQGDTLEFANPPLLDLTDLTVTFGPGVIEIKLVYDATTNSADLEGMSGFVDFDVDLNDATGRPTHIEEFGYPSAPVMGVDYYVFFYPFFGMAELFFSDENGDTSIGFFSTTIDATTVSVTIPRCELGPLDGICIGAVYELAALVGNSEGATDRAPNGEVPLSGIPSPGDFDEDGDVDVDDFNQFDACATRASVSYIPGTFPASCTLEPDVGGIIPADFDEDGDVDQDDFGEFQRHVTGMF